MPMKSILFAARRAAAAGFGAENPFRRAYLQRGILLLPLAIVAAWFALSLAARAVDPPPAGGYPGQNTALGADALFSLTVGIDNTAIGFRALFRNTTGISNTAIGRLALHGNTTGNGNTATGSLALQFNTTGGFNTANGAAALLLNTTGSNNTAAGNSALFSNTTGSFNTATGFEALRNNTTGSSNMAAGAYALNKNTTGIANSAAGYLALGNNTTGSSNTATGYLALLGNTTGIANTASGVNALSINSTGGYNTANGFDALRQNTTGTYNTAIGSEALWNNTTGSGNIALGRRAGYNLTTGHHNIAIGSPGAAADSKTIRIGRVGLQNAAFIAGIHGSVVPGGVGVFVLPNGQLGTSVSSARFKEAIKPMDKLSEAILALKPVTFRYKRALDPEGIPQFGLVAEEVEKVNPGLVARDTQGKINSVRYEAVNAMLLNEFLKEHRKVKELETALARQQKDFAEQAKAIKALAAGLKEQALQIRKMNGQLEARKPALRIAADKQESRF
ncbi:MAG: tail fiber domain-containing protein [Beijerinckiaceae bacterium]|nr:tail fiber domain-containing protein [Beijerinckiaceae bacterium]